jgi:hypothetical protein
LNVVQGPLQAKEGATSLWALAYRDLQKANPELVESFSHCLGIGTALTDTTTFVYSDIKGPAHKALEEINEARNSKDKLDGTSVTIRKYFEQTIKIVIASKDFISSAVSANPYAALAWTGVSLLLPVS